MRHTIVYIHGVGGVTPVEDWLDPLNASLAQAGYSAIDPAWDDVVAVTYQSLVASVDKETKQQGRKVPDPAETWRRTKADDAADQAFALRQEAQRAHVAQWAHERRGISPGLVPVGVSSAVAATVARVKLVEAGNYASHKALRAQVIADVLAQIPPARSIIIVAHSLGSVIAADLLTRLPEETHVELLLTLGSPLVGDMWKHNRPLAQHFPHDRVGSWVNLYDPLDPVTHHRGIARRFPMALDVPVNIRAHSVRGYAGHGIVGELVGRALYGDRAAPSERPLAKVVSPSWNFQLLAFAFAQQVSRSTRPDKFDFRSRFDTARRVAAIRLLEEFAAGDAPTDDLGRPPSLTDFLDHPTDLVRGTWPDAELVPLLVSLLSGTPLPPFDFAIDPEHRRIALERLCRRIRRAEGERSDEEFVAVVSAQFEASTADLTESRRRWWGYMIGGGAALLALTGVGLWAALPAALAGAAAVTATLAAFGPGGMVGGMITLVLATGAGASLVSAGAVQAKGSFAAAAQVRTALAGALVAMELEELRGVLIGILTVVRARDELGVESVRQQVRDMLVETQSRLEQELHLHTRLVPKAAGTKELAARAELIARAVDLIDPVAGELPAPAEDRLP